MYLSPAVSSTTDETVVALPRTPPIPLQYRSVGNDASSSSRRWYVPYSLLPSQR
jgi:hypothetical protein